MKKAVVIGGYGHIGAYLVPRLVNEGGYDVAVIARNKRLPYTADDPAWEKVTHLSCDRAAMTAEGKFGKMIAEMKPELVFDAVCYTAEQAAELCEPLAASSPDTKLIEVGSIWVYGYPIETPVTENHVHNATCDYGKGKTNIENYLRELSKAGKLNTTVLHPGHICGNGWCPITPQANFNPEVFKTIVRGGELLLPNDGNANIHPVHSDDIAGLTMAVLANPDKSNGEAFNAVAKHAVTLRGYAEAMFERFGHKPDIAYLPFADYAKEVTPEDADATLEHISHNPCCSMEKAEKLLGFVPEHSVFDTVEAAVRKMIANGMI